MEWFLEPRTKEANKFIGYELASQGVAEESWKRGVIDTRGKKHNVWRVQDHEMVERVLKSEFGKDFNVFGREGEGKLQDKTRQLKTWLTPGKNRAKKAVNKLKERMKK